MFTLVKIYCWKGVSLQNKPCRGRSLLKNINLLRSNLRRQGIIIQNVKLRLSIVISNSISAKNLLFFTRQIARLLHAGLPLVRILELLENCNNIALQKFTSQIKLSIESGFSFTEALNSLKQPYFNSFYLHLISLGERTSNLDLMLTRVADNIEKNSKLRAKLTSILIYPSIVISVSIFIFSILLIEVVPQFEQLFTEAGTKLPFLTQLVIDLSKFLQRWSIYIGLFVINFFCVYIFLKVKYKIIAIKHDKFLIKLPIVKNILRAIITARLSRALATALLSGLPLLDALQAIAELIKNYAYKNAILCSCELIRNGEDFYQALIAQKFLPFEFLQFVELGEVSGCLIEMLNNVADLYEEKIDNTINNLSKLFEPLLIIILGTIIGGLIIAMYLPIFKLGSVI